VGPFIAANLVASGCPAFPSPIACLDAPWSIGISRAADYASYVRDVARWQRRGELPSASMGWIGPWISDHPWITLVAVSCFPLAIHLLRRVAALRGEGQPRVGIDGARTVVAFALLGAVFAAWQAPAPRFLYAYVIAVPVLAVALGLHARPADARGSARFARHGTLAFVATSVAVGAAYAVASQKLNLRSALARGASLISITPADLLIPAAPALPPRLFRWRVNDVDVLTPVPRPVADTLDYRSTVILNSPLEKCSTAPLPCTPYLPKDVRLRRPARGVGGGFVRERRPELAGGSAVCVGEMSPADALTPSREFVPIPGHVRCGDDRR